MVNRYVIGTMSESANSTARSGDFHAWNPGVQSSIPHKYLPLASIFRPENCAVSFKDLQERAEFTGLELDDLVIFRPERIALHSLLIRITANVCVSDGQRYEDLGINFRRIAATLDETYLTPLLPEAVATYDSLRDQVFAQLSQRIKLITSPPVTPAQPARQGLDKWLPFLRRQSKAASTPDPLHYQHTERLRLQQDAEAATSELDIFCWRSLTKLVESIATRHGRIVGDSSALATIATGMAMNLLASKRIGELVERGFANAATNAGLPLLPSQSHTTVLNTKGASASGKSTLRPLQHDLCDRLGLDWRNFALISPDIWRKYLLDYDGLGEAWRYAGSLSGMELRVVDHKLDLYMATRHQQKRSPHLLIDRFRFDSFQLSAANKGEDRLLTRFGDEIFMMFMVTPPEALVERAWRRGLEVGRFKPVDDLLDHCVEAYQGMPPLFFRWALRQDKNVHYEFLDNSVAKGCLPRTIAFGKNGSLLILSIKGMLDVSRFRRIDILAKEPDKLWAAGDSYIEQDREFLCQCADLMGTLEFAIAGSGQIYATLKAGCWVITDEKIWTEIIRDPVHHMALMALGDLTSPVISSVAKFVHREDALATLGDWGARSGTLTSHPEP